MRNKILDTGRPTIVVYSMTTTKSCKDPNKVFVYQQFRWVPVGAKLGKGDEVVGMVRQSAEYGIRVRDHIQWMIDEGLADYDFVVEALEHLKQKEKELRKATDGRGKWKRPSNKTAQEMPSAPVQSAPEPAPEPELVKPVEPPYDPVVLPQISLDFLKCDDRSWQQFGQSTKIYLEALVDMGVTDSGKLWQEAVWYSSFYRYNKNNNYNPIRRLVRA